MTKIKQLQNELEIAKMKYDADLIQLKAKERKGYGDAVLSVWRVQVAASLGKYNGLKLAFAIATRKGA